MLSREKLLEMCEETYTVAKSKEDLPGMLGVLGLLVKIVGPATPTPTFNPKGTSPDVEAARHRARQPRVVG